MLERGGGLNSLMIKAADQIKRSCQPNAVVITVNSKTKIITATQCRLKRNDVISLQKLIHTANQTANTWNGNYAFFARSVNHAVIKGNT